MDQDLYKDQIDAIRRRGGDVICSFGGEYGKELANVIEDPVELEAAYQKILDRYHFTWLDFDVEGNNLDKGRRDSERRNTVLADLQRKIPTSSSPTPCRWTLTVFRMSPLPCSPTP